MINQEVKISPQFRTQTTKAIFSIVFFAVTYLVILLITTALTALCIYGGIMLIALKPTFITIALGIGLSSLGVLVLIFLLKFIFKSHASDRSHLYEITESEEPELFKLIQEIVNQVDTTFPKRVYLSANVNASVFYDSNFWSMLFPVKKNLQIGLGLINTTTYSELKAILSHEFGHFSQRSMKVGSYVYNVNQVIFNILYDNESYDKLIQSWASVSGFFSIFVVIAVKIIGFIQWVLKGLYQVVNKSYMGLSREMEFHADEIAANVTGYEPLKNSLLRMELADYSFNSVLSMYESKVAQNISSQNVYQEQSYVMTQLSNESELIIQNGFPQPTLDDLNKFNKSKLIIEDQWASHPSTEDRIERLEKLNVGKVELLEVKANSVFQNIEETQKKLTKFIFKEVKYEGEIQFWDLQTFQYKYEEEYNANTFPKIYNGYYDNKNPILFDLESLDLEIIEANIEDLFASEKVDVIWSSIGITGDIEVLKQIADKTISNKTFDYAGRRYKRKEARNLVSQLEGEFQQLSEKIKQNDIEIYQAFRALEACGSSVSTLKLLYEEFFAFDEQYEKKYQLFMDISERMQFINYTTPFDQIKLNFQNIVPLELRLKDEIKIILADPRYLEELNDEIKSNLELYLSKELKYFYNEAYDESNLEILFTALNNYAFLLSKGYFVLKRKLLSYQQDLVKSTKANHLSAQ